jgi:hypothetical protein
VQVQRLCRCVALPHASSVQEIVDSCRRRAAFRHVSELETSTVVLPLTSSAALRSSACATLELPTWYSNCCSSNSPQYPSCPGTREECCISFLVAMCSGADSSPGNGQAQLPVTVSRPPCCSAPWARRHLTMPLLRHRLPKLASSSQLTTHASLSDEAKALPNTLFHDHRVVIPVAARLL